MAEPVIFDDLHTRMDALLAQQHQRMLEMAWRMDGLSATAPNPFETFTVGLDDARDDRAEYSELDGMAQLHDRIEALEQARQAEQSREHGMGY